MAIMEIKRFQTDDGTIFTTFQEAKDHEQREELINWIMSGSDLNDRYTAGDVIDALHRKYNLVPKE